MRGRKHVKRQSNKAETSADDIAREKQREAEGVCYTRLVNLLNNEFEANIFETAERARAKARERALKVNLGHSQTT